MIAGLLKGLIGPVLDSVTKLIPDKNKRAEAKEAAEAAMMSGVTAIVQGQLEINKMEAQHKSIFVAGWRPAVGWVCGFALAWSFILQPFLSYGAFMFGKDLTGMPEIALGPLLSILMGMLGMGGLRTYEKRMGVANETMGKK